MEKHDMKIISREKTKGKAIKISKKMVGVDMEKQLVIKASKCLIVLYEQELFQLLGTRPDLFEKAISRGKGYKRAETTERRMNGNGSNSTKI